MRIVHLFAENVKRLRVVQITPTGNLQQITGANGSGKSSVLDSILWALAGKGEFDPRPVRDGEEMATVRLDLGDIIITRKIEAGTNKTSLAVESKDGARYPSPQAVLDHIRGKFMDPVRFTRLSAKEQAEVLRGLVHLEVDLDALDRQAATAYEQRTIVNREAKALTERHIAARELVTADMPADLVDVDALLQRIEQAGAQNDAIAREQQRVATAHRTAETARAQAGILRNRAAALRAQADELEADATAQDTRADELALEAEPREMPAPVDVSALTAELREAQQHNAAVEKNERAKAAAVQLEQQAKAATAQSKQLTKAMDEALAKKAAAIAAAEMPVAGLSFGPEGVTFNGFPLEQCSSAEQLRVSTAIAMAASPKLRVLWIQDGSLLDEKSLAMIGEMANAGDYQVWVERVDTSGKVGVVMEDGAVVAVDGVPVPPADEAPAAEAVAT